MPSCFTPLTVQTITWSSITVALIDFPRFFLMTPLICSTTSTFLKMCDCCECIFHFGHWRHSLVRGLVFFFLKEERHDAIYEGWISAEALRRAFLVSKHPWKGWKKRNEIFRYTFSVMVFYRLKIFDDYI